MPSTSSGTRVCPERAKRVEGSCPERAKRVEGPRPGFKVCLRQAQAPIIHPEFIEGSRPEFIEGSRPEFIEGLPLSPLSANKFLFLFPGPTFDLLFS